jgi:hypothetical protein
MATPDLIDRLVHDLAPVPRTTVVRRLALGFVPGIVVSVAAMLLWLGPRPDMMDAMATSAFWMKFAYTVLLAATGLAAVLVMARPEGRIRNMGLAAVVLLAVAALLAIAQLSSAPAADHHRMIYGASAKACPWNIVILSLPVFAGAFWALRGLAPTRLTVAGTAAGLAAGAFGALVYSFHCDESAMPFVAIWYTLGIVIAGVIGAALGRWLVRW